MEDPNGEEIDLGRVAGGDGSGDACRDVDQSLGIGVVGGDPEEKERGDLTKNTHETEATLSEDQRSVSEQK